MRYWCLAIVTAWMFTGTAVHAAELPGQQPPIGTQVEDLDFKDIWYLPRQLSELGEAEAYLVVFTLVNDPHCEAILPAVKQLAAEYPAEKLRVLAVNSGPRDTIVQMSGQEVAHEAPFPFVKDFAGSMARALGVTQVPTVVLLDANRAIRYRGPLDDRFAHDDTSEPQKHYARAALEAVLTGSDISTAEVPVTGTEIPWDAPEVEAAEQLTYAGHVAEILNRHCVDCHRPDTEAPFTLTSYDDAANHAEMIAEVVTEGRMPPWYANHGTFDNAPTITEAEKEIIRRWVASDREAGDLGSLTTRQFHTATTEGGLKWQIEEPDLVISMKKAHSLPAHGYVPYKYVMLPYRFPHDTWIQQCEILPDNPRVVHHCNMAYIENALDWNNAKFILGKVPGVQPMLLPAGVGYKIPAGSVLILQIHYTTTGQEEDCNIHVGLRYARDVIDQQFHFLWMDNGSFQIPPGEPMHRVTATNTLDANASIAGMFAHMHLRGRHMTFLAHLPDGTTEKLLSIPNFSFDWQLAYRFAPGEKVLPKGTKIECISHYDNSKFNPYNPAPDETVKVGQQTFEEMLNGVMFYLDNDEKLNLHIDPKTGAELPAEASDDVAQTE